MRYWRVKRAVTTLTMGLFVGHVNEISSSILAAYP